jgi:Uncharacterized protein conserved in bacteria (DUF2332)
VAAEVLRLGVLRPTVAEAAHRAGASAVGLVDLGSPVPVEPVAFRLVGHRPVPARELPEVVLSDTVDVARFEALLPGALANVPADVLPVVITTWALSRLTPERRLRFLQLLDAAATHRTVAWVSVEGVGVAPGVPTLGDRLASGHSIVGVALLSHAGLHAEAVGRCWSRGRQLAWLAES